LPEYCTPLPLEFVVLPKVDTDESRLIIKGFFMGFVVPESCP
jgi:hypothetical protein